MRRYKRFLADVVLENGQQVVAHCPNPGSMMGLAQEGATVWLHHHNNPKRKLSFSWELVEAGHGSKKTLVGINTLRANAIVGEALREGLIPQIPPSQVKAEVTHSKGTRLDFLLTPIKGEAPIFIEVKSVTLSRRDGIAEFPDSQTTRGAKHMATLESLRKQGTRSVVFFLIQREDCEKISIAHDIDSAYAKAFGNACAAGVEVLCYNCRLSPKGIALGTPCRLVNDTATSF